MSIRFAFLKSGLLGKLKRESGCRINLYGKLCQEINWLCLWKEIDAIRTYFVHSDEGLVGEYGEGGQQSRSYGYKPGSTWTTDPLFLKVTEHYYFYQNDHLGTPQKMIGINGGVAWSGKYSTFGKTEIEPGSSVTNNLRFAG